MPLPRPEVTEGFAAELHELETLIRTLADAEWAAPTRCAGWRVADVAAHLAGNLVAVATGELEEFADPTHVDRQVATRRDRTRDEVADELAGAAKQVTDLMAALDDAAWALAVPGGVTDSVGEGLLVLWYDAYVHGEDIRAATGRAPADTAGLRASVHCLADTLAGRGWGPATLALDGLEEIRVSGGGRRVTGDPRQFVLAATGRADPAGLGLDETVNIYAG